MNKLIIIIKTAGAFLKGFLDYEGDVTPIMSSLLTRNEQAYSSLII